MPRENRVQEEIRKKLVTERQEEAREPQEEKVTWYTVIKYYWNIFLHANLFGKVAFGLWFIFFIKVLEWIIWWTMWLW